MCIISVHRLVGWFVAIGQHFDMADDVFDTGLRIWRVWNMGIGLVRRVRNMGIGLVRLE